MQPTVLVIGAGTAGTAASIFLRQKGVAVVLVERSALPAQDATPKIGESLPPDGRVMLEQLDVWDQFKQGPHLPCHGNKSYWHSDTPQFHDFLQHPAGHGWHLDRLAFDRMLLDKAVALGTEFRPETTIREIAHTDAGWKVHVQDAQGQTSELNPTICIDASGRNSWLARQLGVERYYEDDQLALVTFYQTDRDFEDTLSLRKPPRAVGGALP